MEVIRHLKLILARHGIPAEIVSGNRPQFSAEAFAKFTKSYGITCKTSNPKKPQGRYVLNALAGPQQPYLLISLGMLSILVSGKP